MFQNALNSAIDGAHPRQIDHLSRQLWAAHAAGHIPDGVAQDLGELLHQRRQPAMEAQGVLFPIPRSSTTADRKRVWTAFPARADRRWVGKWESQLNADRTRDDRQACEAVSARMIAINDQSHAVGFSSTPMRNTVAASLPMNPMMPAPPLTE